MLDLCIKWKVMHNKGRVNAIAGRTPRLRPLAALTLTPDGGLSSHYCILID